MNASAASEEVRRCDEFIFSLLIETIILPQSFSRGVLRRKSWFYCSARRELSNGVLIVRRLPSAASLHNFTPDHSRLTLTGALTALSVLHPYPQHRVLSTNAAGWSVHLPPRVFTVNTLYSTRTLCAVCISFPSTKLDAVP